MTDSELAGSKPMHRPGYSVHSILEGVEEEAKCNSWETPCFKFSHRDHRSGNALFGLADICRKLCFLTLFGAVHGRKFPTSGCNAQAWVRAPDLTPNTIMHGDARVKISAECPAIENVSLGLRFKEMSSMNILGFREDVKQLDPEHATFDFSNESPWTLLSRYTNKTVEEAHEETLANEDLWIFREEERVVFETTQPINIGSWNHGTLRDAVQDFSILVPSTNFPPVLEMRRLTFIPPTKDEIIDVQWIYEYFAQISFSNGTTKEIPAGFTTFRPLYDPTHASQGLTSATVELEQLEQWDDTKGNSTNYSIEISAESGLTFFAGSKSQVVTAVVTRAGLARTFSAPLNILVSVMPNSSPTKWAAEYDMSEVGMGSFLTLTSVLREASEDDDMNMWRIPSPSQPSSRATVSMPNSTSDEIQANEIVTTTSAPFTISVDVDDTHIPTFETYYQTLANSLTITLEIPQEEDEDVDPEDPSGERDFGWGPQLEDDEEAWVPWRKKRMPRIKAWDSYWGRVPVVVHPTREGTPSPRRLHASTDMSEQVVLSDETDYERPSLIHYLDSGARGPTFVDRNVVHKLLAEGPAARELRAPILEPIVSPASRYYLSTVLNGPPIYVGETWARKVVNKDDVSMSS